MTRRFYTAFAVLIAVLLAISGPAAGQGLPDFASIIDADQVMAHVEALSVDIGARPMGSEAEELAADYVADAFEEWGYEVEVQEFETTPPGDDEGSSEEVTSRNVIATMEGEEDGIIVVGAHMDSVTDGTGAGDNASGVAAILAAAEALADVENTYTLVFIAFGAEEGGEPSGAMVYVEELGEDLENVIAMINVDSVGMGTNLNAYAGAMITWPESEEEAPEIDGGPTWVRDLALDLAAEMGYAFSTTPDETWGGFTGDWSDHYAFVEQEIPVVYFEAWEWGSGEFPWWGQETDSGDVMHTPDDVFENVVPEKVEMAAEVIAATAAALATGLAEPPM